MASWTTRAGWLFVVIGLLLVTSITDFLPIGWEHQLEQLLMHGHLGPSPMYRVVPTPERLLGTEQIIGVALVVIGLVLLLVGHRAQSRP